MLALLLVNVQFLFAQINRASFRQLSDDEQFTFVDTYITEHWHDFLDPKKKPAAVADYKIMLAEANGPRTICLLKLFWHRNQVINSDAKSETKLADIQSVIRLAHDNELRVEEAICQVVWCIGVLRHGGKIEDRTRRILVYDAALQAITTLEKQPLSVLHNYHGPAFDIDHHLWWMSIYFFSIEEYELARQIALFGEQVLHPTLTTRKVFPYGYNFYKWQFLNDLGSCHLRLGKLREADHWYRKAYLFARSIGSQIQSAVSYGNLGVVLSKQGKPAAAIPHLERAVQVARLENDRQSEFNALVPLSEVYLHLTQYDKAYRAIQRSMALYDSVHAFVNQTDSLNIIPLFAGLGEVYQHRGNLNKALFYTQLANRLTEKKQANDDYRIFRQKQERYETEAYQTRLNQIDADRDRAVWLEYTAIGLLVLVALGSLLYISYQRKRRREAEQQLERIAEEARARTGQLIQLQQAQETATKPTTDENLPHIARLMELAILTEADWERFQQLFEQVYPNYLLRLRRKHTLLTPAETRIICLSRLSLSTKEMADMLGVSTDTIFKTRYRIRKKTSLPEGADLGEAFADV
ncbi:hypothetical protein GCM10023187_00980 [Nibrella viscosa]|uniref:HTH luxR-type domain-containing protein n=1 Tax=Nibrella viscosa TaxID=1084524 RepID=A0ABP8JR27_9BACT